MTTLKGLDFMALQVFDLEKSKKFYTDILGFKEIPKAVPDAVLFDTKPFAFAIRKPIVDLNMVTHLGHGIALWFYCDDSEQLYKRLKENNVELLSSPNKSPFGQTFQFKDINGYVLTVHDKA